MEAELVAVGRVVRPQGRHGEVRLLPLTDAPERLRDLSECFLVPPKAGERRALEAVRFQNGAPVVKLAGSESLGDAEALVGRLVSIPREVVRALASDHYYAFDLIGCAVETPDGATLGVLDDVQTAAGHDLWVVRTGARTWLLPAVSAIVLGVDLTARRIVAEPPDGLLELEG